MPVNMRQNADGTISFHDERAGRSAFKVGGPAVPTSSSPRYDATQIMKTPLIAGVTTAGGLFSWQNNLGYDIIVTRAELDVTTISTGVATVDIGATNTNGTTNSTTLFSAQDVNGATGTFNSGIKSLKVANGKWITGSAHSAADTTGMVASLNVHYYAA